MTNQESAELRWIGDTMQSASSRVLEFARQRTTSDTSYETMMAMLELDDAINQWTDTRIGYATSKPTETGAAVSAHPLICDNCGSSLSRPGEKCCGPEPEPLPDGSETE